MAKQINQVDQQAKLIPFGEHPADQFIDLVKQHEGLLPTQTPFRITDRKTDADGKIIPKTGKMQNWISMFDKTLRAPLNPNVVKPEGREEFLYVNEGDEGMVPLMIREQFRLYAERNPEMTVGEAVNKFDQTGAENKLKFIEGASDITRDKKLKNLF